MKVVPVSMRVSYLGPEGTFTHLALRHRFGAGATALPSGTIRGVFEAVESGAAERGVVPVENSSEGIVTHTLDRLGESDLLIAGEIVVEVEQCLLARAGTDLGGIERVYSHPQALAQCRAWLARHLPAAASVELESTAAAARRAADEPRAAAVGAELAAELHGLAVLRRAIHDVAGNATRFLVIGREPAPRTGRDKTSLLLAIHDGPGVLHRILGPFAEAGVNLTRIESRPSRRRAWEYVFFVDVEGHRDDPPLRAALAAVAAHCEAVKILGSYPAARTGNAD